MPMLPYATRDAAMRMMSAALSLSPDAAARVCGRLATRHVTPFGCVRCYARDERVSLPRYDVYAIFCCYPFIIFFLMLSGFFELTPPAEIRDEPPMAAYRFTLRFERPSYTYERHYQHCHIRDELTLTLRRRRSDFHIFAR